MRRVVALVVGPEKKGKLETTIRPAVAALRDVQRAHLVLLAAAGQENREIAAQAGLSLQSVSLWRQRWKDFLPDLPGSAGVMGFFAAFGL